jgi:hypothetical protein
VEPEQRSGADRLARGGKGFALSFGIAVGCVNRRSRGLPPPLVERSGEAELIDNSRSHKPKKKGEVKTALTECMAL